MKNNLLKRIIVGLVGIPLAVGAIWMGGFLFGIAIVCITSIALWEYYRLAKTKSATPNISIGLIWSVCIQVGILFFLNAKFFALLDWAVAVLITAIGGVTVVMTAELWRARPNALLNTGLTISGVSYVTAGMSSVLLLRFSKAPFVSSWFADEGAALVLTLFVSVWLCDTAAYFFGMNFGKHKLFPRISPHKSWEGALGGGLAAIASFAFFSQWMMPDLPMVHAIVCGAIVAVIGQIGDLSESLLKRDATIKDSSQILPGHGGILDRFDSMLFAAPALFVYLSIVEMFLL